MKIQKSWLELHLSYSSSHSNNNIVSPIKLTSKNASKGDSTKF